MNEFAHPCVHTPRLLAAGVDLDLCQDGLLDWRLACVSTMCSVGPAIALVSTGVDPPEAHVYRASTDCAASLSLEPTLNPTWAGGQEGQGRVSQGRMGGHRTACSPAMDT